MGTKKTCATSHYDASNAKKDGIGVFVIMHDTDRQFLFGPTAVWRWKRIAGRLALEVEENGDIAMHAWASCVTAVGGPQVLFRDAQWK